MFASRRFTENPLLDIYENEEMIGDKSFYKNWSYEDWKKKSIVSQEIISLTQGFALSDYITLVARKQ